MRGQESQDETTQTKDRNENGRAGVSTSVRSEASSPVLASSREEEITNAVLHCAAPWRGVACRAKSKENNATHHITSQQREREAPSGER